jgi:[ribosomal protein S5]-alanine N-acetyltransferase
MQISEIPILETNRLCLRPIRRTDAPRMQEMFPHFELVQYMAAAIPWPYPSNGAEQFLDHVLPEIAKGSRYVWAITLKAQNDDLLIGVIDLFPTDPNDNRGFWLGLPYQNQAYMTEAVAAVNDFAFDVLRLPQLILNNAEPNIASHRLKEKAGATIVEIRDDVAYIGGIFREIRWTLTKEQWNANRHRFHVG